jgi:hypothetical protein
VLVLCLHSVADSIRTGTDRHTVADKYKIISRAQP